VRTVLTRAAAAYCAFVLATSFAGAGDSAHSRSPNELQGFSFYSKYLAPLQPGLSGRDAVRRVLDVTAPVKRNGWRIIPIYAVNGGSLSNPTLGALAEIILTPDGVIPMAALKFPPRFAHCHSFLSEINMSFDVYSDTSGLEYWLYPEDSELRKRGDLFQIVYGPKRKPFQPNAIC